MQMHIENNQWLVSVHTKVQSLIEMKVAAATAAEAPTKHKNDIF